MDSKFSLIREPWLMVIATDGHPREVSLSTLFHDAASIRELSGDIPQQVLPLLRLALAILHRAYYEEDCGEPQLRDLWKRIWDAGHFDMDVIEAYFDDWDDRFFLLGDSPFFQVPGLVYASSKRFDSVGKMVADVPSKPDKFLFSMRSQNSLDSLSLAEAARWLVFLQAYDTAGIKTPVRGNSHVKDGKVHAPKGMAGMGWLGALGGLFVEGRNLFETLMLNWCLYNPGGQSDGRVLFGNPDDVPVWERDAPPAPDSCIRSGFVGESEVLTWQSRRIRLVSDASGERIIGIVSCYGDAMSACNTDAFEEMTAWRLSPQQQKKLGLPAPPRMPVAHDASKALWRGLEPILQVAGDNDLRPGVIRWIEELRERGVLESWGHVATMVTLHAQGMTYGPQSSVYETGIDDVLTLDASMLRHDYGGILTVTTTVAKTDKAVNALVNYVRNLQASAGDKASKDRSKAVGEQVREAAYGELDGLFRDRIAAFSPDRDPESYGNEWTDEVHRRLLSMGREYLAQSSVPVFAEHEAGVMGAMGAARAQLVFRGALNKILGIMDVGGPAAHGSDGKESDDA